MGLYIGQFTTQAAQTLYESGRRKGATKVFKHRRKSPWVPIVTRPFPNGQANAGSWLGTKNALYYCAQSTNSISWVLFVSSYMTTIDSITACLAHAPKNCTQSGNFQFDINSPFQNTVYPKTTDPFPKIQAWAYNRYSRLHRSLVLRNTREFLKDTTMADSHKTSHGKVNSHFFSLYRNYSNSLTLSNASELFWAEFLLSISKFMKIMNFVIACLLACAQTKLNSG